MNLVALKMLFNDKAKFLGLIFAIGFSTFLLENQTSIFAGIMKRTGSQVIDVTDADIWVMDPKTEYFEQTKALKETDLTSVRSVPGVAYAVRLFKGMPIARTETGKFSQTVTLGLDDATLIGAPQNLILGNVEDLRKPQSIIIDRAGFYQLFPDEPLSIGRIVELNDKRAEIVGISEALAPFASFPIVHARYSEAVNFQGRERKELSFILVRAKKGIFAENLISLIEKRTGLRARTAEEFKWDCIRYYLKNTGIPVNFGITIAIALVIGLVVSGQTFFLFTLENIKFFATYKAVGVSTKRLVQMVLLQAASVGFIGFSFGTLFCALFFEITLYKTATRGLILMWQNVIIVAVLMSAVILLASIFSVLKIIKVEPATVFRG